LTRASQNSDDTFATAKSLGSLSASSSPVSFNFRGQLSRTDRDDFLKLQILPGAAFSSIAPTVTIRGAGVRLLTAFEFPGGTPQPAASLRFRVGRSSEVISSPFANTFGVPLQIYLQIRRVNPTKRVSYNFNVTFNP
jgi:hypothetical protein